MALLVIASRRTFYTTVRLYKFATLFFRCRDELSLNKVSLFILTGIFNRCKYRMVRSENIPRVWSIPFKFSSLCVVVRIFITLVIAIGHSYKPMYFIVLDENIRNFYCGLYACKCNKVFCVYFALTGIKFIKVILYWHPSISLIFRP